ncbi:MAG: sugar phosphate isomerase/epimerase [Clostridia bacterium]|nr:sugar phosphate isomerase/epimerase [Clostridia bacterium]
MYPIGLSSCGKPLCEELFVQYHDAGIAAMEISISNEQYDTLPYADVAAWANKHSVKLWSLHLPFMPFHIIDISSTNRELQRASITRLSEILKRGAAIGIDKFVIHPSGEPIADGEREERMLTAQESLYTLADVAAKCGGMIAVENLPRTCLGKNAAEMARLTEIDPRLGVCFDTNHLLGEEPISFIHRLGNKIVTTHISDYDFVDEKHWLPGEGRLNWTAIAQAFAAIDYRGVWLYELGFESPKTLPRPRDLTCEDFVNNANEIFAHKKPTVIA